MSAMVSQITSVSIVCSTVCSGADQRKHQSPASLAFVRGIHRWPVNSPHKGPVTRKKFPIALKTPVWSTPSGIYCIEGPCEFSTQSAEVRLAVSGGQPLSTLWLPMFVYPNDNSCLCHGPPAPTSINFIYDKNIIWRTKTKSSKNSM